MTKRFKPPQVKESNHPTDGRLYVTEHKFRRSGSFGGETVRVVFYHDGTGELYLGITEPDGDVSTSLDPVAAQHLAKLLLDYADKLGADHDQT